MRKKAVSSRPTWVRLSVKLKQLAQAQAKADGRTLSGWIARLVERAVREDENVLVG